MPIEQQIEEPEFNESGAYLNNTGSNETWLNKTLSINETVALSIFARNLTMKLKSQMFEE